MDRLRGHEASPERAHGGLQGPAHCGSIRLREEDEDGGSARRELLRRSCDGSRWIFQVREKPGADDELEGLLDKVGVEPVTLVATASPNKSVGNDVHDAGMHSHAGVTADDFDILRKVCRLA